jgi:plastocyanin
MENLVISPAETSVKIGDTIEWINKDGDWDLTLPLEKTGCHCWKRNPASK